MKRKFVKFAMFAAFMAIAVSCQKEQFQEVRTSMTESVASVMVCYSINDMPFRVTLSSDAEVRQLMAELVALAREGYTIKVYQEGGSVNQALAKDVVTYVTSSETDALDWAAKMVLNGYHVTITYDDKNNQYVCVAVN